MKTKLPLDLLLAEARSFTFNKDDTGVLMARVQSRRFERSMRRTHPIIFAAMDEISDARTIPPLYFMVNIMPPGCMTVPVHKDAVVGWPERWHLPIQTNEAARYWDRSLPTNVPVVENQINNQLYHDGKHMELGVWTSIEYRTLHTIWNPGQEERVHLIVDLDARDDPPD